MWGGDWVRCVVENIAAVASRRAETSKVCHGGQSGECATNAKWGTEGYELMGYLGKCAGRVARGKSHDD